MKILNVMWSAILVVSLLALAGCPQQNGMSKSSAAGASSDTESSGGGGGGGSD